MNCALEVLFLSVRRRIDLCSQQTRVVVCAQPGPSVSGTAAHLRPEDISWTALMASAAAGPSLAPTSLGLPQQPPRPVAVPEGPPVSHPPAWTRLPAPNAGLPFHLVSLHFCSERRPSVLCLGTADRHICGCVCSVSLLLLEDGLPCFCAVQDVCWHIKHAHPVPLL